MRFGALVLTHNEERHIGDCLRSLAPAQRVVVVDSGSTDATHDLVAGFPGVEWVVRPFTNFSEQRNFGLERFAPRDWILHLDADERLTPALAAELEALVPGREVPAYNIPSRTLLDGRAIDRASGYPVYQTRLTRSSFRFVEVGHGQKAPLGLGPLPALREPYTHLPFEKGHEEWLARHRRYAAREAEDLVTAGQRYTLGQALRDPIARRQWLRRRTARLRIRPALVWLYLMLWRRGILDGPAGWKYCRLRATYEQMVLDALAPSAPRAR